MKCYRGLRGKKYIMKKFNFSNIVTVIEQNDSCDSKRLSYSRLYLIFCTLVAKGKHLPSRRRKVVIVRANGVTVCSARPTRTMRCNGIRHKILTLVFLAL